MHSLISRSRVVFELSLGMGLSILSRWKKIENPRHPGRFLPRREERVKTCGGPLPESAAAPLSGYGCWQIIRIFEQLAETNHITIRVRNLKLRQAIKHSLQPSRHDTPSLECRKYFPKTSAFAPQINVPIIRSRLGTNRRRAATQHQLHLPVPKDGELMRWARGKRIADKTQRTAIPLDRASHICDAQQRNCLSDSHNSVQRDAQPELEGSLPQFLGSLPFDLRRDLLPPPWRGVFQLRSPLFQGSPAQIVPEDFERLTLRNNGLGSHGMFLQLNNAEATSRATQPQ